MSMSTSRWLAAAAVAAGVAGLTGGCQQLDGPPIDPVFKDDAVVVDPAMRERNWEPATVEYASGDVIAGPTLFPYEPDGQMPDWAQAAVSPLLMVGQSVASPVTALITPVWGDVRYEGVDTPPTYAAIPPVLPTDPATLEAAESAHLQAIERQERAAEALSRRPATPAPQPPVQEAAEPAPRPLPTPPPPAVREPEPRDTQPRVVQPPPAPPRTTSTPPAATQPATRPTMGPGPRPAMGPGTRPTPGPATQPAELNK